MATWQAVAVGLIPSIGVGLVFWFVMRAVMRADRSERNALARIDGQDAQNAASADAPAAASGDDVPAIEPTARNDGASA